MQHTVSLELAKRMQELGWKKETYFRYFPFTRRDTNEEVWITSNNSEDYYDEEYSVSAPMADEILEELPAYIERNNNYYGLSINKNITDGIVDFDVRYSYHESDAYLECENKLSDCLAPLWCKLREENLI